MNWYKSSLMMLAVGLTIALTTACGSDEAAPATPTAIPSPLVQVTPSFTPIPASPTLSRTVTALPSRIVTPTQTWTPPPGPKDTLMAAFTKALANLKTYRVEVVQESRLIAVQLPDRFFQEGLDRIVKIGDRMWMVGEKGTLTGTGSLPFFDRANINWYRDQFARSSQVILLGPGTAEGVPCIGYTANFTMTGSIPPKTPGATPATTQVSMPVKIWFATTDGFPRRIEMAAPLSLTINFYDFNDDIVIEPPQ